MVGHGDNVNRDTTALPRRSPVVSVRSPRWEVMPQAARAASQIIPVSNWVQQTWRASFVSLDQQWCLVEISVRPSAGKPWAELTIAPAVEGGPAAALDARMGRPEYDVE